MKATQVQEPPGSWWVQGNALVAEGQGVIMFRLTTFMRDALGQEVPASARRRSAPTGPVVIWNLVRRCNLACKHCYSVSADRDYPGELTTAEVKTVLDDLKACGVPAVILSGGEPLLRPDIFEVTRHAKSLGLFTALSSNGTLIDDAMADAIAAAGYDYVGVSLDGIGPVHDRFRRKDGAFAASIAGIRACRERGIKAGLRFTLTQDNYRELPALLDLLEAEELDKFYLSHLNYAGRGNTNRGDDANHRMSREAMTLLFERCLAGLLAGRPREYVTGNNDADGAWFLLWVQERFPERAEAVAQKLRAWGGNASGIGVANIDTQGQVRPDTAWVNTSLGCVKDRPFSEIWADLSHPVLAGLRRRPRPVGGRCGDCRFLDLCNGNTRIRGFQLTGDMWAEDPGCYLGDDEIGVTGAAERLAVTPYRGKRVHAA